ncbi:MAG: hypothetical protein N4A47_02390 [Clostridia bacterium]|jgi:hypothetical protein|nr:hypothetical protein [Clostridia bacterium]
MKKVIVLKKEIRRLDLDIENRENETKNYDIQFKKDVGNLTLALMDEEDNTKKKALEDKIEAITKMRAKKTEEDKEYITDMKSYRIIVNRNYNFEKKVMINKLTANFFAERKMTQLKMEEGLALIRKNKNISGMNDGESEVEKDLRRVKLLKQYEEKAMKEASSGKLVRGIKNADKVAERIVLSSAKALDSIYNSFDKMVASRVDIKKNQMSNRDLIRKDIAIANVRKELFNLKEGEYKKRKQRELEVLVREAREIRNKIGCSQVKKIKKENANNVLIEKSKEMLTRANEVGEKVVNYIDSKVEKYKAKKKRKDLASEEIRTKIAISNLKGVVDNLADGTKKGEKSLELFELRNRVEFIKRDIEDVESKNVVIDDKVEVIEEVVEKESIS